MPNQGAITDSICLYLKEKQRCERGIHPSATEGPETAMDADFTGHEPDRAHSRETEDLPKLESAFPAEVKGGSE